MRKITTLYILFITFCCLSIPSHAAVFILPQQGNHVGSPQRASSEINETLEDAGRRFGIGYNEMIRANPQIDPLEILPSQTALMIPSRFSLPKVTKEGIVINLAEYRLYYYPPNENVVITFPVGVGKKGWKTPIGTTKITAKVIHPTWRPTAKILAAAEENGTSLPDAFPPGADNPLGDYALRLGIPSLLIHGTNRADGIGARVSAGCIRMLPDDIEYLFNNVTVGTNVRIINEPHKNS